MLVLKKMIYNKAKFLRNFAFVLLGFSLGAQTLLLAVIGLVLAIIFDYLSTITEVKKTPRSVRVRASSDYVD